MLDIPTRVYAMICCGYASCLPSIWVEASTRWRIFYGLQTFGQIRLRVHGTLEEDICQRVVASTGLFTGEGLVGNLLIFWKATPSWWAFDAWDITGE